MALPSAVLLPPDTRANQPAAASVAAGTLYCVSDEGNILEQSDGAAWVAYSPVGSGSGDVTASGTLTADALMLGDGTTVITAMASLGTTTTVLHGNAAGAPTYGAVVEADITLADNTTNNAATTKHGFLKKLSNVGTEYMDGTGAWSVPAGSGGAGVVVQVVSTQTGAVATGTTVMPLDDTIPQNTEGTEFMTLAITPTDAGNKLRIDVVFYGSPDAANWITVALFQDTTANALAAFADYQNTATASASSQFTHHMTAGTTSATTFKVRAGRDSSAGTTYTFNGASGVRRFGGVLASSITITEYVP